MGCDSIRSHITDKLGVDYGQTTDDDEYTLIPVPCLGDCDNAPVMMVGDDLHRKLTPEKIDEIIANYQREES